MIERCYLDNAASTSVDPRVLEAMLPYFSVDFGNSGSLHYEGRQANRALEEARAKIARLLGAKRPDEIIFTSGGSESDNAAILGIVQAAAKRGAKAHVLCSAFEHHAVLNSIQQLQFLGHEADKIPVDKNGFLQLESARERFKDNTLLLSVMAANNEIGTVQNLAALAELAHSKGAYFHTDAVQALGKLDLKLDESGVDAAAFSSHKIYGPKGVGVLYLRARTPFRTQMPGGGQEAGRRSGTPNVAGAVGFAAALELALAQREVENARLQAMRDRLAEVLISRCPSIHLSVDPRGADTPGKAERYLPGLLSIAVQGCESQSLMLALDNAGFSVSGGSACHSKSLEPSHVLSAIGMQRDLAFGALRISMGRFNTPEQLDRFADALIKAVGHQR